MPRGPVDRNGNRRIKCKECGTWHHALAPHLGKKHGMSVEEYIDKHRDPDSGVAPLTISEYASKEIDRNRKKKGKRERPTSKKKNKVTRPPEVLDIGGWEVEIRPDDDIPDSARDDIPVHDEHWEVDEDFFSRVAEAIFLDEVLMIVGPTGGGKTSGVGEFASLVNAPWVRIQGDKETSVGKLFGKTKVVTDPETKKRVTVFVEGIIPRALRLGYFIVIDEVDGLDEDIRLALHEVLEKDAQGRRRCTLETNLDDEVARVVWAHPRTRFFLTGNNLGSDLMGLYGGTDSAPNLAFLDRCERVNVTYPPKEVISSIVHNKSGGLDVRYCDLIANAVHEILEAHVNAGLTWVFSIRRAVTLGLKFKLYEERGLPKSDAVQRVILDNVPTPDIRNDVRGIIQRVGLPVPTVRATP